MSNPMFEGVREYYNLAHLTLFTGLTDRTLRKYLQQGILVGEKINGLWHFTPEQVEAFLRHPAVRPSIKARQNSLVYDFLLLNKKKEPRMCMILDLPGKDRGQVSEFFCYEISHDPALCDLRFAFDGVAEAPRVILTGLPEQVLSLVQRFCAQ